MLERVNANLVPFAKNNVSGYRFAFGTGTVTDDINDNYNTNIQAGWGTAANQFPEVEDFNALAYTATYLTSYLYQMGISEWNENQDYFVNSRAMGSDGLIYKSLVGTLATPNAGNDPVGDTINWEWELASIGQKPTGQKNLLINGRKLIQQRGATGGRIQVVLNTRNLGGEHTISWTGTATVTIKEAATLGASDALTTWDTPLVTGATSGTNITLTANKYVHVEFSTTNFDFAQLELGNVASNYAILEDDIYPCLPYFEAGFGSGVSYGNSSTLIQRTQVFYRKKISTPLITFNNTGGTASVGSFIVINNSQATVTLSSSAAGQDSFFSFKANSEIFNADDGVGINYKEDRWYV